MSIFSRRLCFNSSNLSLHNPSPQDLKLLQVIRYWVDSMHSATSRFKKTKSLNRWTWCPMPVMPALQRLRENGEGNQGESSQEPYKIMVVPQRDIVFLKMFNSVTYILKYHVHLIISDLFNMEGIRGERRVTLDNFLCSFQHQVL